MSEPCGFVSSSWDFLVWLTCLTINIYYFDDQIIKCYLKMTEFREPLKIQVWVRHACNHNAWETEAGGLLWVQDKHGLRGEAQGVLLTTEWSLKPLHWFLKRQLWLCPSYPSFWWVLTLSQPAPQHPRTARPRSLGYRVEKTGKKIIFTFTSWDVLITMPRNLVNAPNEAAMTRS